MPNVRAFMKLQDNHFKDFKWQDKKLLRW
jgi:hypothetical protein